MEAIASDKRMRWFVERFSSPHSKKAKTPIDWLTKEFPLSNQPIAWFRFLAAITFLLVTKNYLFGQSFQSFSIERLRYCLIFHHTVAAMGLDEGLLINYASEQSLFRRLCTPGARMTPFIPSVLPKFNVSFCLYYIFLVFAGWCLWYNKMDNYNVGLYCGLFLSCCIFDVGLFYSTRPGDVFKFLVATLFQGKNAGVNACYLMIGSLYMWSGISKLRGWFYSFVFQYWFCILAPITYFLSPLYLKEDGSPNQFGKLFAWMGAFTEFFTGFIMLVPFSIDIQIVGVVAAVMMHTFICTFGIGPYRWNFVTIYLSMCSWKLKSPGIMVYNDLSLCAIIYVIVFGFAIPVIGLWSTTILGRYFGGYRMANFHFAGNEMSIIFLIETKGIRQQNIDPQYQVLGFSMDADGLDIRAIVQPYLKEFTPLRYCEVNGKCVLNTKLDPSLESITFATAELTRECYNPKGRLLMVKALPVDYFANHKRCEIWDMTEIAARKHRLVKASNLKLPWTQYDKLLREVDLITGKKVDMKGE